MSSSSTPGRRGSQIAATVWLSLTEDTDIEVPRREALSWTEDDFVALYERHVTSASRSEAETWAERQVEERDAYIEGREPRVERG